MSELKLPKELEELRSLRVWICHPMIYNPNKHGGKGGYDKPPIDPHTLRGPIDYQREEHRATFDEAAAQIGKTAQITLNSNRQECTVAGVGVALKAAGLRGLDLDNVAFVVKEFDGEKEKSDLRFTPEAADIFNTMDTYTELSPGGLGLHMLFKGGLSLPEWGRRKAGGKRDPWEGNSAEYQYMDASYMTISGRRIGTGALCDRTDQFKSVYYKYIYDGQEILQAQTLSKERPAQTSTASPVVSCSPGNLFTRERWLQDVQRLSDSEILDGIFQSKYVGDKVRRLYEGDTAGYPSHSEADLGLMSYLYGFTGDAALTKRLFLSSGLYRAQGKSRKYIDNTLIRAIRDSVPLTGHIVPTTEEKQAYGRQKRREEAAEREAQRSRDFSEFLARQARGR